MIAGESEIARFVAAAVLSRADMLEVVNKEWLPRFRHAAVFASARSACAERYFQIRTGRWDFLTGSEDALYRLIKDGFKLGVSDGAEEMGVPVHSTRAVLVDRKGTIRGYYDLIAPDSVTKLLADTSHLLREQPQ